VEQHQDLMRKLHGLTLMAVIGQILDLRSRGALSV